MIAGATLVDDEQGRGFYRAGLRRGETYIGLIDRACLEILIKEPAAQRHPFRSAPQGWLRTPPAASSRAGSASVSVCKSFRNWWIEARTSARSRYSLRYTSSYFTVFINDSQAALSHGLPLRDMLIVMP